MDPQTEALISYIRNNRLFVDYAFISALALIVFDWFLTVGREVELMWSGKWSYTTFIFLFTRYMGLFGAFVQVYYQIFIGIEPATCKRLMNTATWIICVSVIVAEAILFIRTWAAWGRNKYIGILLLATEVAVVTSELVYAIPWSRSIVTTTPPYPEYRGCFLIASTTDTWKIVISQAAGDIVALILMSISAWRAYSNGNNAKLSQIIHRDAIVFYLFFLVILVISAVVTATFPNLADPLAPMISVTYPVLSCRVILNLRDVATSHRDETQPDYTVNDLHFWNHDDKEPTDTFTMGGISSTRWGAESDEDLVRRRV